MSHKGIVVLGLSLFIAAVAEAGNWPRFHGPNGTGVAADKDIPIQWTEKDGLLWKAALPGSGNSSPIVWGSRIFLTAATDSERSLVCLNAADGKIIWTASAPGVKAHINAKNSLASSTPATDGERVYTLFWNGKTVGVHAFDFDGKEIWKRDLGDFKSQHGYGASPVVYHGIVYVNNDQDGAAALLAFDAKTGKDVFQVPRQAYRACYSTPFVIEENGTTELIVVSTAGISGYDPKTGTEAWVWKWTFDGMALRTVGSAAYGQGIILAVAGDGRGDRHAAAIKKGSKGDVTKTNLLWENKKSLPYVPSVLAQGEHMYFVNDKGFAGCADAKSGKLVWFERLNSAGVSASPVLIDGKMYVIDEKGDVFVVLADTTFKVVAKSTMGEAVFASPAVADGRLYIRGKDHLFCVGKK